MDNRTVIVGVCGIVAVTILMAGITSLGNGATLSGAVLDTVAYLTVPTDIEKASVRYLRNQNLRSAPPDVRKSYPTITRDATGPVTESTSSSEGISVSDFTACASAKDIADRFLGERKSDLPRVLRIPQSQESLQNAFRTIVAEYCPGEVTAPSSSSSARSVENNCERRFTQGSARYVVCVREGKSGRRY